MGTKTKMKTAFITGSSRGIGKAIAKTFCENGYNVALNGISNKKSLFLTESELKKLNKNVISVLCDISNYEDTRTAISQIYANFGNIDVLVNNAGISYTNVFNLMSPNEWQRLIDVNLKGTLNTTHCILPQMLKNHSGVIINISSIWGQVGASCEAVYSLTKGGLNSFTKALAKETAPNGIRVNAIACGVIDTDMNNFLSSEEKTTLIESIPVGRFGTASEIADLALFLASSKASYITGQIITADGGFI